jgi:hypothetical protein
MFRGVATFEDEGNEDKGVSDWLPTAPALTLPLALITDVVEVRVFSTEGGPTLAGAIELVSPSNPGQQARCHPGAAQPATCLPLSAGAVKVQPRVAYSSPESSRYPDLLDRWSLRQFNTLTE